MPRFAAIALLSVLGHCAFVPREGDRIDELYGEQRPPKGEKKKAKDEGKKKAKEDEKAKDIDKKKLKLISKQVAAVSQTVSAATNKAKAPKIHIDGVRKANAIEFINPTEAFNSDLRTFNKHAMTTYFAEFSMEKNKKENNAQQVIDGGGVPVKYLMKWYTENQNADPINRCSLEDWASISYATASMNKNKFGLTNLNKFLQDKIWQDEGAAMSNIDRDAATLSANVMICRAWDCMRKLPRIKYPMFHVFPARSSASNPQAVINKFLTGQADIESASSFKSAAGHKDIVRLPTDTDGVYAVDLSEYGLISDNEFLLTCPGYTLNLQALQTLKHSVYHNPGMSPQSEEFVLEWTEKCRRVLDQPDMEPLFCNITKPVAAAEKPATELDKIANALETVGTLKAKKSRSWHLNDDQVGNLEAFIKQKKGEKKAQDRAS